MFEENESHSLFYETESMCLSPERATFNHFCIIGVIIGVVITASACLGGFVLPEPSRHISDPHTKAQEQPARQHLFQMAQEKLSDVPKPVNSLQLF